MLALSLAVVAFLAGLALMARRSSAGGSASRLGLGLLPLTLLFVPVQVLHDVWQLVTTFKAVANGSGSIRTVFALCLEHQRAWSVASWLVVGATALAGGAQLVATRFERGPEASAPVASAARAGLIDWTLALSALMVVPVGSIALLAQRIEAGAMGFTARLLGVELPPPFAGSSAAQGGAALGRVIGTEAVLAMFAAAMIIAMLLALAGANVFLSPRRPVGWAAFGWSALGLTCAVASFNAVRVSTMAAWAERVLALASGP